MEVYIEDKELKTLYTTGKSRKLKIPEPVVDKFFSTIKKIRSSTTIHDFWHDPSMKFEKLQGFKNRYSIRLTGKYRLEIEIQWINEQKTTGKFYLKEISVHYGD